MLSSLATGHLVKNVVQLSYLPRVNKNDWGGKKEPKLIKRGKLNCPSSNVVALPPYKVFISTLNYKMELNEMRL